MVEITKKEFEKMYFSMTNEEMAKKLKTSHVTIQKNARKLGLRKRKAYDTKPKIKIIK